jgi:hypothetical protein
MRYALQSNKTEKTMNTPKVVKILTIASSSLALLMGGLAQLPIDSASLPMPAEWRPYLTGTALLAAAVRIVIIPVLDNIAAKLKEP